jgi:hypothetical protein
MAISNKKFRTKNGDFEQELSNKKFRTKNGDFEQLFGDKNDKTIVCFFWPIASSGPQKEEKGQTSRLGS